jgi:serine/threonine protein kinase
MGDLFSFYHKTHRIVFDQVFDFALQLAQGTFSLKETSIITASRKNDAMFLGLDYLHSENVVHNDIKPPNVLLFNRGNRIIVKYSDFGCPPPPFPPLFANI